MSHFRPLYGEKYVNGKIYETLQNKFFVVRNVKVSLQWKVSETRTAIKLQEMYSAYPELIYNMIYEVDNSSLSLNPIECVPETPPATPPALPILVDNSVVPTITISEHEKEMRRVREDCERQLELMRLQMAQLEAKYVKVSNDFVAERENTTQLCNALIKQRETLIDFKTENTELKSKLAEISKQEVSRQEVPSYQYTPAMLNYR